MNQVKEYLIRLGLNNYQASALETLFHYQELDAKEISKNSGVPYTKVYEALEFLERNGLVRYTPGKPRVYKSIESEKVFDMLIEKQKEQTKKLESLKGDVLKDIKVELKEGEEKKFESKVWMYNGLGSLFDEAVGLLKVQRKKCRS